MTGANNEVVETFQEFNESQSDYKITPVFKGTYPETLNAGIAAFRAKQPPTIMQVFDASTGTMMAAEARSNRLPTSCRWAASRSTEPISAGHRVLLFEARRHDAVVPLQFLLADPLLQQGYLQESGPGRE
jgi:hypothetical protein